MATVRMSKQLREQITTGVHQQFRRSIEDCSARAQNYLQEKFMRCSSETIIKRMWNEHYHLREIIPLEWCHTLGSDLTVQFMGPKFDGNVREIVQRHSKPAPSPVPNTNPSDLTNLFFPELSRETQEEKAQGQQITLMPATDVMMSLEYNMHSWCEMWGMERDVMRETFRLPPKAESWRYKLVMRLSDVFSEDEVREYLQLRLDAADAQQQQAAALNAVKQLVARAPSINRLLKDHPELEPLIPGMALAKVREPNPTRAKREQATPEEVPEAPDTSGLDALRSAAALTALNQQTN